MTGWLALRLRFESIPATLILLGINLIITAIFGVLAARSSPGQTEQEALRVRRQALDAARGTLALAAAVPAVTRLLGNGGGSPAAGAGECPSCDKARRTLAGSPGQLAATKAMPLCGDCREATTAFFFLAGERLRHDRLLRHPGQLEVDLLFFLERLRKQVGHLLFTERLRQR